MPTTTVTIEIPDELAAQLCELVRDHDLDDDSSYPPDRLAALVVAAIPRMCRRCEGCGQIADSADGEPWSFWLVWTAVAVPVQHAVTAGLVRPISCPDCGGAGRITVRRAA